LHYVPPARDAAINQEGPEPEQVDEEELATDEEEEHPQERPQQEAYTTYSDLYSLQGSTNDMSNLAVTSRHVHLHEFKLLQLEPRMGS
jgi:hypothetical protein